MFSKIKVNSLGSESVIISVVSQSFSSTIITSKVPALRLVKTPVVFEFPFKINVCVPVPPVTFISKLPDVSPAQRIF